MVALAVLTLPGTGPAPPRLPEAKLPGTAADASWRPPAVEADRAPEGKAVEARPVDVSAVAAATAGPGAPEDAASLRRPALVQVAPPEDFEVYLQPQRTLADVYFGGRFVLSTMVTYTPATVEFHDPGAVVAALPEVLGRPVLTNHLTGTLPSHPELVCVQPGQPLCGRLEPDFIGVIFDETRFRADVFVHPELRAPPAEASARYLSEPPDNGPSLVQNLSANYSGSDFGEDRYSLFGQTRVGMGTRHLFGDWVSQTGQSLAVEELGYQEDLRDHQIRAGLYEPTLSVLRAMRQDPLAGISVTRSFHGRTDISSIIANDIELFLATRSQVDLLRDGRLYDSRFYDSGNQRLDTARLPAGAYTLQIRITDAAGTTRTLERFYVKSSLLAPPGHDVWFAEFGRVMLRAPFETLPDDGGAVLGRAGYQHRVNSRLGLGVAGAAADDDALGELSAVWVDPSYEIGGEVFGSTDGAAGWGARGIGRFTPRTGASINLMRVWSEADQHREYRLLRDDVLQRGLQVSHRLQRGLLIGALSESRSAGGDVTRSQTLQYNLPLLLSGQDQVTLSAQLARIDGDFQGQLAMEWRRNHGRWQYQLTPRARFSNAEQDDDYADGAAASAAVSWRDDALYRDDINVTALLDADGEQVSAALLGQHASPYGRGRAGVNLVDAGPGRSTLSSAAFDTNLVATGNRVAFGGPELAESALLLDMDGAPEVDFDVMVDSQRKFTVRGDRRSVVALRPYHSYRVLLRDVGTDYVRYDDAPREATLWPGQVRVLQWKASGILVAVGRLVMPNPACGTATECDQEPLPLGDVILEGTEGVTVTDPDGFFQGEILTGTTTVLVDRADIRCKASLADPKVVNGVALYGDLLCVPEPEAIQAGP